MSRAEHLAAVHAAARELSGVAAAVSALIQNKQRLTSATIEAIGHPPGEGLPMSIANALLSLSDQIDEAYRTCARLNLLLGEYERRI